MPSTQQERASGATPLHYQLTNEEWLRAVHELKPRERDVLYYLRTLNPWGDREIEVSVRDMARVLSTPKNKCSPGTVSTALKTLERLGWIELEIASAKIRLRSKNNEPESECSLQETMFSPGNSVLSSDPAISPAIQRSLQRSSDLSTEHDLSTEQLEIVSNERIDEFSTETQNVPEQKEQTLLERQNWSGDSTTGTNREERTGTSFEAIATLIPAVAGVPLNPALESVLRKVWADQPHEAEKRVRNAISSYLEQREVVHNAQAFISAALRRGFTSNEKKKQNRTKKQNKQEKTNFPPPAPSVVADLSGLLCEIQVHCKRLEITSEQALERFGRKGRSLTQLSDIDLATLRNEMARW